MFAKVGLIKSNDGAKIQNRRAKCKNYVHTHVYIHVYITSIFFLFLTAVNTFSCLFSEKYFLSFEVPPFHLAVVIALIISELFEVELWVELGWNYVKFHPNSTYNSTSYNTLIIR